MNEELEKAISRKKKEISYRSQHVLGCRFTVRCDYEQLRMTITRKRKEGADGTVKN